MRKDRRVYVRRLAAAVHKWGGKRGKRTDEWQDGRGNATRVETTAEKAASIDAILAAAERVQSLANAGETPAPLINHA